MCFLSCYWLVWSPVRTWMSIRTLQTWIKISFKYIFFCGCAFLVWSEGWFETAAKTQTPADGRIGPVYLNRGWQHSRAFWPLVLSAIQMLTPGPWSPWLNGHKHKENGRKLCCYLPEDKQTASLSCFLSWRQEWCISNIRIIYIGGWI